MFKPQTPKPQNVNLFGNKVFADVLRMRSQQNRKDPSADVTGIFTERGNLDTDMHTGREPCEHKGRQNDAEIESAKKMLQKNSNFLADQYKPRNTKIIREPSESRRAAQNRSSLRVLRRSQPGKHPVCRVLSSRMETNTFLLLKHPVYGTLFQKPEQMHTVYLSSFHFERRKLRHKG